MNARRTPWLEGVVTPLIFLVLLLVVWQSAVRGFKVPGWLLPAPTDIAKGFTQSHTLWRHTLATWSEAFAGFAISAVAGVLFAAAITSSRFLEKGVFPYMIVANSVPVVAIVPLLTIWMGFGAWPKVVIASIMTFFPIVTNTARGIKSADPRVLELMQSINATHWQRFSKVEFPSALPYIFAAFKIAISLSLIGAVVGEFYGADVGLGHLIVLSATQLQTDQLFVCITILAATGVSLFFLFGWVESRFARWQP